MSLMINHGFDLVHVNSFPNLIQTSKQINKHCEETLKQQKKKCVRI